MNIINGKVFSGNHISISGNKIIIDGKEITDFKDEKVINITCQANIESLSCDTCEQITVHGSVGSIKTMSGDVKCGNVEGNISTMSGDVECKEVKGSVKTMSGDITGIK